MELKRKIAITGPESTGKTTLAQNLANHFHTLWVPEYAREYINNLNRPYKEEDLVHIARGQVAQEAKLLKKANKWLFSDTEMLVIKIWAELKFGNCKGEIYKLFKNQYYDLYILCGTDIPWVPDPQREDPDTRDEIYQLFYEKLKKMEIPFIEVKGNLERRIDDVTQVLKGI